MVLLQFYFLFRANHGDKNLIPVDVPKNENSNFVVGSKNEPLLLHESKSFDISAELDRLRLDMQGAQVEDFKKYYQVCRFVVQVT